ncbi:MAG TPA: DNA-directed RNA polymerase subunit omega [Candidatus Polarisedimenticolaceae bacterium]|nr:DNA-directed RNA polymerase subunit omega [Candidatus Polarisedimenticolaceae bacterium]
MFKIPEGTESKYRFVMLAALRAEQLQAGALPRVDSETRKATVLAQEEVAAGLVEPWDGTTPEAPAAPTGTDE